ncbi:hypothetical protein LR48_Vigan09g086900 [Vigna angularis]|uniref:Uncharacterized protein n=2 Tax=Phaseolus angularis TaxID=3914 RepID=A0A0L9VAW7_PHAAN|nr:uncharacterized protein HKW66_Vig0180810 [Vigna angularis]KOM52210.1 hypothetical protein LR48_Vigan09g086900 [Vigna angularis]BAT88805.1 hypothetical protein VIGAN_05241900 [Vigna angularis var. angularis]
MICVTISPPIGDIHFRQRTSNDGTTVTEQRRPNNDLHFSPPLEICEPFSPLVGDVHFQRQTSGKLTTKQ